MEVCLANKWCWRTDASNDLCWQLGRIVWDIALSNKSCARYLSGCLFYAKHCSQAFFQQLTTALWSSETTVPNIVVPSLSRVQPCDPTDCSTPGFSISWSLLKLMSIESVMPHNHVIFCCPLLLLPSVFPIIRASSSESALCIRWPKDWSFSISPSNEYSGLISFRMDWLDLLVVQGTFRYLL